MMSDVNPKKNNKKKCGNSGLPIAYGKQIFIRSVSILALTSAWAVEASAQDDNYIAFSLEELLDVEVTSVSKKSEKLIDIGAAVYVIRGDEILRSGAKSLPEVLSRVPGIEARQIDGNKWAISARGFNDRFANKLLVLLDGRTLYTPVFSGVFWDLQDLVLADIDRVEVIRGPGATVWGANAVNGVINIITKNAKDTLGSRASVEFDDQGYRTASLRHGVKVKDGLYLRGSLKYQTDDGGHSDSGNHDGLEGITAGIRIDWEPSATDQVFFETTARSFEVESRALEPVIFPTVRPVRDYTDEAVNIDVLGKWTHKIDDSANISAQFFVDHVEREFLDNDIRTDILDFDFVYDKSFEKGHSVVWGLGHRTSWIEIEGQAPLLNPNQTNGSMRGGRYETVDGHFNTFVQADFSFFDDALNFGLGAKVERNEYTGWEIQPKALASYKFDNSLIWASVSRAVRTPSFFESRLDITLEALEPFTGANITPIPMIINFASSRDFESEEVLSYEAGFRTQLGDSVLLDIAAFFNDYEELRASVPQPPVLSLGPPTPHVITTLATFNELAAETHGVEVSLDYTPNEKWGLRTNYSYLNDNVDPELELSYSEEGGASSPKHKANVTAYWHINDDWLLNTSLHYSGEVELFNLDEFYDLDMRLAWSPVPDFEIALTGRNLIEDNRQEFVPVALTYVVTEVERSVGLSLDINF